MSSDHQVAVDVRPRAWRDHALPVLVLINVHSPRRVMPVFFTPPEGTREHAVAQHNMQKLRDSKCKYTPEQQVPSINQNIKMTCFCLRLS